jgi:hypothetical protein
VGGAYFFLLAIVCLRANRTLARFMAAVALLLDSVLLLVMLFTAPCFDCLVVAFFLGLTYYRLCFGGSGWFVSQQAPSLLLPIWLGLFLSNVSLAANEQIPYFFMGNSRTDMRIYFSPSCEACRAAILMSGNTAALYPVEENSSDVDSIIRLEALLKANVPLRDALPRSINPNEPVPYLPFYERLLLSVQLMRNKAVVLRQGFQALPMIQINGMPVSKTAPREDIGEKYPETRKEENITPPKEPTESPAPSQPDPAPAGAGEGQPHGSAPGSVNEYPQPAHSNQRPAPAESAQPDSTSRKAADHAPPAQSGQISGNGRGHANPENLTDFLLQNTEEFSRCSRSSGQSCN